MADQATIANAINSAIVVAVITAIFGAGGWYYREDQKRKALQRMLLAEICSFVAVIRGMALIDSLASSIQSPASRVKWKDEVSKENYFTVFESNASNLGLLDSSVIGHIVACYSFMKGSRDATRALARMEKPDYTAQQRVLDLRAVAQLVALSLDQANAASNHLVEADSSLTKVREDILPQLSIEDFAEAWRAVAKEPSAPP
jgi:hypothetical protein